VDKKKTHKNLALGFSIKRRFSSPLNLLGQGKATPSQGIPKEQTLKHESGGD
jgi:hypothetical protein